MNKLYTAMQTEDTFTENGMPTHSTSGKEVLDMFYKMGGVRAWSEHDIARMFSYAFGEDSLLALKAMFYNRDVRQGQGERHSFRAMFSFLCREFPEVARKVLHLVPVYGRWDDVLVALDTDVEEQMVAFVLDALHADDILAKKWMPRENKSKGALAKKFMRAAGLSPKFYRDLISHNEGEVVETLMCSNKWGKINYNHVPSGATKKYRKAFGRHDFERYSQWLAALERGDKSAKINAGAIFPHDIVKPYLEERKSTDRTLEAQWKALPDFVQDGLNFLPVVDTSASMHGDIAWLVAFSLGVYLAERNKSIFKDAYVSFSRIAKLIPLRGTSLRDKVETFVRNQIVEDTNLESVFELILDKAVGAKVRSEEMPTHILIISDMQFNLCVDNPSDIVMKMIAKRYAKAGYELPQVIFWNVRTSEGVPVKFDERGTAIVSGFSPSLMKNLLSGELTPEGMMMAVLGSERYDAVEAALA